MTAPNDPKKTTAFARLRAVASSLRQEETVRDSLTVAKKRQQYMLPRVPEVKGYDFAFIYHPAEHVSGDFCDIIDLGGGRYGILLGDISGHGMEAGLIMGAARKALQIYARSAQSPIQALSWANDDLYRDLDRQTFLTVGYAVLDTSNGVLQYVRAGHTHPLLLGPERKQWEAIKCGGTTIGVTKGEHFTKLLEEKTVELRPAQSFVQYTDGVIEAHDRTGREYGMDRFIDYLQGKDQTGKPLGPSLEGLLQELNDWAGGADQEDDITVLAVKRVK
jgi:serine phosphatase RsbU (regulator of sigma subunit)